LYAWGMTYNERRETLEISKGQLEVEPVLDHDGELEISTGWDRCENGPHYFFLTVADMIALRDHIDAVLEERNKPRVVSREEAADFARRWDARVEEGRK